MPEQTIVPPIPDRKDFNALRDWRMAHNRDDYPSGDSYHEGFAGIVGCTTDRWCRECEHRIDVPHRKDCSVTAKEEAMVTPLPPHAAGEEDKTLDGLLDALDRDAGRYHETGEAEDMARYHAARAAIHAHVAALVSAEREACAKLALGCHAFNTDALTRAQQRAETAGRERDAMRPVVEEVANFRAARREVAWDSPRMRAHAYDLDLEFRAYRATLNDHAPETGTKDSHCPDCGKRTRPDDVHTCSPTHPQQGAAE